MEENENDGIFPDPDYDSDDNDNIDELDTSDNGRTNKVSLQRSRIEVTVFFCICLIYLCFDPLLFAAHC